jgi:hypothetical protein
VAVGDAGEARGGVPLEGDLGEVGGVEEVGYAWLGNALDAAKRSQILFMDRDDILNLYVVTNLPLPEGALPAPGAVTVVHL